ncbi:MAG: hypothetical protein U0794_04115 [Isosphaeraceae bacterium]
MIPRRGDRCSSTIHRLSAFGAIAWGIAAASAGPELSDVASRGDREYLLRSLVEPDAAIAEGFGTVQLALRDGRILAGLIRSESGGRITIVSPTGLAQSVAAEDVEERSAPRSAMPRMTEVLTPRQLRDLVAYLATLRAPGAKGKAAAP